MSGGEADSYGVAIEGTLAFFVFCFLISSIVRWLSGLSSKFRAPLSVSLFVIGMLLSLLTTYVDFWLIGRGTRDIEFCHPHIIFLVLLPILLYEASSNVNWHVFKRIVASSLLLAVPGVIINVFIVGPILYFLFPYMAGALGWNTSLMVAAILSATDPVAVVAALHDLQAPAKLAHLIDGESLLNDGSSVVLFFVFRQLALEAEGTDSPHAAGNEAGDAILFFLRLALGGPLFGLAVAIVIHTWLRLFLGQFVVEVTAVISGAYISYFVADVTLGLSGVLAVVAYGVYFAAVGKFAMNREVQELHASFVEELASLSNQALFVIAGVITCRMLRQAEIVQNAWIWGELAFLYVLLFLSRSFTVALFAPLLTKMGYGLNTKEGLILVYGGLRGAIGMALGLVVEEEKRFDKEVRERVTFHIAGIVFLTLLINGSTVTWLYKRLKIYKPNPFRVVYWRKIVRQIEEEFDEHCVALKSHWLFEHTPALELARELVPNFQRSHFEPDSGKLHLETPPIASILNVSRMPPPSEWRIDPPRTKSAANTSNPGLLFQSPSDASGHGGHKATTLKHGQEQSGESPLLKSSESASQHGQGRERASQRKKKDATKEGDRAAGGEGDKAEEKGKGDGSDVSKASSNSSSSSSSGSGTEEWSVTDNEEATPRNDDGLPPPEISNISPVDEALGSLRHRDHALMHPAAQPGFRPGPSSPIDIALTTPPPTDPASSLPHLKGEANDTSSALLSTPAPLFRASPPGKKSPMNLLMTSQGTIEMPDRKKQDNSPNHFGKGHKQEGFDGSADPTHHPSADKCDSQRRKRETNKSHKRPPPHPRPKNPDEAPRGADAAGGGTQSKEGKPRSAGNSLVSSVGLTVVDQTTEHLFAPAQQGSIKGGRGESPSRPDCSHFQTSQIFALHPHKRRGSGSGIAITPTPFRGYRGGDVPAEGPPPAATGSGAEQSHLPIQRMLSTEERLVEFLFTPGENDGDGITPKDRKGRKDKIFDSDDDDDEICPPFNILERGDVSPGDSRAESSDGCPQEQGTGKVGVQFDEEQAAGGRDSDAGAAFIYGAASGTGQTLRPKSRRIAMTSHQRDCEIHNICFNALAEKYMSLFERGGVEGGALHTLIEALGRALDAANSEMSAQSVRHIRNVVKNNATTRRDFKVIERLEKALTQGQKKESVFLSPFDVEWRTIESRIGGGGASGGMSMGGLTMAPGPRKRAQSLGPSRSKSQASVAGSSGERSVDSSSEGDGGEPSCCLRLWWRINSCFRYHIPLLSPISRYYKLLSDIQTLLGYVTAHRELLELGQTKLLASLSPRLAKKIARQLGNAQTAMCRLLHSDPVLFGYALTVVTAKTLTNIKLQIVDEMTETGLLLRGDYEVLTEKIGAARIWALTAYVPILPARRPVLKRASHIKSSRAISGGGGLGR